MDQIQNIASAINGYFDLMYDADDNRFADVFHGACLVHGMRDGKLTAWSASEFRDVMRGRPSPAAIMRSGSNFAALHVFRAAARQSAARCEDGLKAIDG
jgi:hypothetical protein